MPVLTLAACLSLNRWAGVEIYFVSLPGWFIAAGPYVVLSRRMQAGFSGGRARRRSADRRRK